MRRRTRLKLALAGLAVGIIGLVVLIVVLVLGRQARQNELAALLAAEAGDGAPTEAAPEDPYDGLELEAIRRVQDRRGASGTIGDAIRNGALADAIEVYGENVPAESEWVARRVEESVYEVVHETRFHGVAFGPRWFVQMDADGPAPEGSGGVVPTNALADWLHDGGDDTHLRQMNRSDEVVEALTRHRFDSGVRLASAMLVFFLGRADGAVEPEVIGWTVIPHQLSADEAVYQAWFQWYEGEDVQDALWEVSYRGAAPTFRARDQRADQIMRAGAEVSSDELIDIRPESLRDVDTPPESERDARVRALRLLLADTRVVEAVGALLAARGRNGELEYVQWHSTFVDDDRDTCAVEYRYRERGDDRAVSWEIDSRTGERTPTSEIAALAEVTLSVYRAPDGDGAAAP